MKATFEHSVAILTKAYLNNTLHKGSCQACAVGNLIADSLGLRVIEGNTFMFWGEPGQITLDTTGRHPAFDTLWFDYLHHYFSMDTDGGAVKKKIGAEQIKGTGYSRRKLFRIEEAFEQGNPSHSCDTPENMERGMYKGLLAVVDVLAKIHKVDLVVSKAAVKGFDQVHQTRILTQLA
jgi:hypothetical protein